MPLDTRIPLAIQPLQPPANPLATLQDVLQIQGLQAQRRQQEREERLQQEAEREQQLEDEILQQYGQDPLAVDEQFQRRLPSRLAPWREHQAKVATERAKAATEQIKQAKQGWEFFVQRFQAVLKDPSLWPQFRQDAAKIPEIDALLPNTPVFDETAATASAAIIESAMSVKENLELEEKRYESLIKGDHEAFTGSLLSRAQNQAQWDQVLSSLPSAMRPDVAKRMIGLFGKTFSPEARKLAANLSMTLKDEEDLKLRTRQQWLQEPTETIVGPDGKPVIVRRSQAIGKTPASSGPAAGAMPKLSAPQQESLITMQTVSDMADDVLREGERLNWQGTGGLKAGSVAQFLAKNFGRGSMEAEQLRNKISNIKATIAKLRGGSALTPQELALIDAYTPTIDDSPLMIMSKLNSLKDYITKLKANTLLVASGTLPAITPLPSHKRRKVGRFEIVEE